MEGVIYKNQVALFEVTSRVHGALQRSILDVELKEGDEVGKSPSVCRAALFLSGFCRSNKAKKKKKKKRIPLGKNSMSLFFSLRDQSETADGAPLLLGTAPRILQMCDIRTARKSIWQKSTFLFFTTKL